MTDEEFREKLAFGREQSGVEFKGPGSRTENRQLQAKVIRAMLSMANRRDGGLVIIGVAEDDAGALLLSGLTDKDLATWNYDDLADAVASYADPSVGFDIEIKNYEGKNYLVIIVNEFEDVPVICKRDLTGVLRDGACYVRTRRKPETSEIPTQSEMRDLLDLAIVKKLRNFVSTANAAGVNISGSSMPSDIQKYTSQLGDLSEE